MDSQDHTSEMDILASLGPVERVFGIRTGRRNKGDRRTRADDFASLIEDPRGTGDVKCRVGHGAECGRVMRATGGACCGRDEIICSEDDRRTPRKGLLALSWWFTTTAGPGRASLRDELVPVEAALLED